MIDRLDARIAAAAAAQPEEDRSGGPQSLRGVRGLPSGKLAELIAAAVREDPPRLPDDAAALEKLFGIAWEDGLAAIGLCATAVAQAPQEALELGLTWAERTDDVVTADALGWLVLGPAAALTGQLDEVAGRLRAHPRPETRRCGVSMALAFTPERVEGPAAAGLREQLGQRQVRIVEEARPELLGPLCARFVRDDAPAIQKALRRVLRAWADADPASLVAWAPTVRGGLPKLLGAEVHRAKRAAP